MRRVVLAFLLLPLATLGFGVQPLASQDQPPPNLVYEAFYRVDMSGLEEWNEQYWARLVPVLEELRDEGLIEGWSQWQHHTGGQGYNIRFTVRTYDWAAIDTFWSEFFSRLQTASPEVDWSESSRSVAEHKDEIWEVERQVFVDDPEVTHLYAATYRVNFSDMGEWDELWTDVLAPILDEAMSEGILTGWVKLGHHTGGPLNSKVLYFFADWENIDDTFAKVRGKMAEEYPEQIARIAELIRAHDDVIWVPTTRDEM